MKNAPKLSGKDKAPILSTQSARDRFINARQQVDRLWSQLWENPMDLGSLFSLVSAFSPTSNVEETDSHFVMSLDLPGVKLEDIEVDVQGNQLIIEAQRNDECEDKGKNHYHAGRFFGLFEKIVRLPEGVRLEQIEAHYNSGVLTVAIPKVDAKPQQIKINDGRPGGWRKTGAPKKEKEEGNGAQPGLTTTEKKGQEKVA